MTDAPDHRTSRKLTPFALGGIGLLIALMFVLSSMHNSRQDTMVLKIKLMHARVLLEYVELTLDKTYNKTHKLPKVTTVLSYATQRQPAPMDWIQLGYTMMPTLPDGVESLRITKSGDIVVRFDHINKEIDGSTVRANANRDVAGSNWNYSCSSQQKMIKLVFGC